MPSVRSLGRSLLAACGLLLLFAGPGCKKYTVEPIEFESWGFRHENYDLMSTDAREIVYPIVREDAPVAISKVQFKGNEPSISITYSQKDSDNAQQVRVVYHTSKTPPGSYPFRITFISEDGVFIERAITINVISYLALMRDSVTDYYVNDTVMSAPFKPENAGGPNSYYYTKIRHKSFSPVNRFYFSNLGYYLNLGTFSDIYVDLDTVTGVIVAPPQTNNYTGQGRIEKFDGYHEMRGYFNYSYRNSSGYLYEGHLSF